MSDEPEYVHSMIPAKLPAIQNLILIINKGVLLEFHKVLKMLKTFAIKPDSNSISKYVLPWLWEHVTKWWHLIYLISVNDDHYPIEIGKNTAVESGV